MVRAMEEINLIKAVEEDKSAEDMWASLITNGLLLAGEDKKTMDKMGKLIAFHPVQIWAEVIL
jgi:hypothetical protein